ncbi:MAG: RNA polymerase sigma factor RpoE [Gammaproteobacteria bacterium]|nr:RNA polymerase sigma factor RpoE [Gammaproteobacteria bacterium]
MAEQTSDQVLVERVQGGDRRAFDVLVLKYQQRILKLIMRLVRNSADAEDVAQEAFIRAYRALPSFRGDSAFYTWLYRIGINTAKNHLVSAQRRPFDQEFDPQDPDNYQINARFRDEETPEGLALQEELRVTVERAIAALPDDLRTAIMLREIDGLSYEQIAQAMDCPVGTVRSRIFRAREAVDRSIDQLNGVGEQAGRK